jgi:glycerate 2-kinase
MVKAKLIPETLLLASEPFGDRLSAEQVAAALARGLTAGGHPLVEQCPLTAGLAELGFDARMRRSRAVVIAAARLDERTLAGSLAFEIATRARQAGVPAYAVTACDELDSFDARMLDLQLVLEARDTPALVAAGKRLAAVV